MDLQVRMQPAILEKKSKFTNEEKRALLNEKWSINYLLNKKRRQWRGGMNEPINRVADFDLRYRLMVINKAAIVQGLNDGSLARLDEEYIDEVNPTMADAIKLYQYDLGKYNPNKKTVKLYGYKLELLKDNFGDILLYQLITTVCSTLSVLDSSLYIRVAISIIMQYILNSN